MNEFKVGQRVWETKLKRYLTVGTIDEHGVVTCGKIFALAKNLHETADDMFAKLGFKLKLEDSSYIIYEYLNFEDGLLTELRIDKNSKKYKLTCYTNNNYMFSPYVTIELHLAIHQMMIELGWL